MAMLDHQITHRDRMLKMNIVSNTIEVEDGLMMLVLQKVVDRLFRRKGLNHFSLSGSFYVFSVIIS